MDGRTLNLTAAVLCGIGSIATLIAALAGEGPRRATRASVLSGVLGTIGSLAWAASAYQDLVEQRATEPTA